MLYLMECPSCGQGEYEKILLLDADMLALGNAIWLRACRDLHQTPRGPTNSSGERGGEKFYVFST